MQFVNKVALSVKYDLFRHLTRAVILIHFFQNEKFHNRCDKRKFLTIPKSSKYIGSRGSIQSKYRWIDNVVFIFFHLINFSFWCEQKLIFKQVIIIKRCSKSLLCLIRVTAKCLVYAKEISLIYNVAKVFFEQQYLRSFKKFNTQFFCQPQILITNCMVWY